MNINFTANYIESDNNFCICNLRNKRISGKEYSVFCVLENILQRGCPTNPSQYLKEYIHTYKRNKQYHFLSKDVPNWGTLIIGNDDDSLNPAKAFYYDILPNYFSNIPYIQHLLIPEVLITDIIPDGSDDYINQRVDFYFPDFDIVVEIDGSQHREKEQKSLDIKRDIFLKKQNIHVIRIPSNAIYGGQDSMKSYLKEIEYIISKNQEVLEPYAVGYKMLSDNSIPEATLKVVSTIRLQIAIIELLKNGALSLKDKEWKFNIYNHEIDGYEQAAINDVILWLKNLCALADIKFSEPKVTVKNVTKFGKTSYNDICIETSILDVATQTNTTDKNIIYILSSANRMKDYFEVSVATPITYKFKESLEDIYLTSKEDISEKRKSLRFLLKNIFQFDEFHDGQEEIIMRALKQEDTIGILPTGGGKSLCYQFSMLLQPAISISVCPIKSLMIDQLDNLFSFGINRAMYISSDLDALERSEVLKQFRSKKYIVTFMSPERFQSKEFRNFLISMKKNKSGTLGYAVIDEVHCLSEWGHSFRTSYLNLIKSIRRFCPGSVLLGLTATASYNVMEHIKFEFGMLDSDDVITARKYTRNNLNFRVEETKLKNKKEKLFEILDKYSKNRPIFTPMGERTYSGLIFTPHVNGKYGCYSLSADIEKRYEGKYKDLEVGFYAGSMPKNWNGKEKEWELEKHNIQRRYKNNEFPCLVATKAFGMGIDKPNIRYTIHYGLPDSIEALYQEAGRAGRDQKDSACVILYTPENSKNKIILDNALDRYSTVKNLENTISQIQLTGEDVTRQAYLLSTGLIDEEEEMLIGNFIINEVTNGNHIISTGVNGEQVSFDHLQKVVYHLSVIGFIEDWTVNWNSNMLTVEATNNSILEMKSQVKSFIRAFDNNSTLEELDILDGNVIDVLKYFYDWYQLNIVNNRKQALLNVENICREYLAHKDPIKFRNDLESFFQVDEDTVNLSNIVRNDEISIWFSFLSQIKKEKIPSVIMKINRFLESYQNSTGLNYISGILNLINGTFDSVNGKKKLDDAIENINKFQDIDKKLILNETLTFVQSIDIEDAIKYAIVEYFISNLELDGKETIIYKNLEDLYSLYLIMRNNLSKLYMSIGE